MYRRKQRSAFDQVSEFYRGRIVAYRDCGLSFREIGSRVGRNQTTVMQICDRWMQEDTTDRRGRSHPPQCTISREDRQIVRMAVTDRSVTSRTVAQHIESVTHHSVSARTIRRRLQQRGPSARRPLLGLPLTQNNRHLHRQWCDERRMWAAEWNEVVFTDESRICLQHHDGRIRVWRHRGERMLNSCVMHRHIGSAKVLATAIFQQDNARPHVARIVQRFFVNYQIELLPWPARSPGLSPMENMWSMVAQRSTQITPPAATPDQLWQCGESAWSAVPQEHIQSLFESMPGRVAAVISNNGGYSGYWFWQGTKLHRSNWKGRIYALFGFHRYDAISIKDAVRLAGLDFLVVFSAVGVFVAVEKLQSVPPPTENQELVDGDVTRKPVRRRKKRKSEVLYWTGETLLGLPDFVHQNCTVPDPRTLVFQVHSWTVYASPFFVLGLYCLLSLIIRKQLIAPPIDECKYEPSMSRGDSKQSSQYSQGSVRRRKSSRRIARGLLDEDHTGRSYRTIESGDAGARETLAVDPNGSIIWTSESDMPEIAVEPLEEEKPHVSKSFGSKLKKVFNPIVSALKLIAKGSYIATLIVMMTWSITYHSWLTFVLLLWSCILWMCPNSRYVCLRSSPALVFYAECLLLLQYIFGLNLNEDELPSKNVAQIGLVKYGDLSYQPLAIKMLYTVMFWITMRQFFEERQQSNERNIAEGLTLEPFNISYNTATPACPRPCDTTQLTTASNIPNDSTETHITIEPENEIERPKSLNLKSPPNKKGTAPTSPTSEVGTPTTPKREEAESNRAEREFRAVKICLNNLFREVQQAFTSISETLWRTLEIHIIKIVLISTFILAAYDSVAFVNSSTFPYPFNTTIDNHDWIGFKRTHNLADYCKGYIGLILVLTIQAVVKIRQEVNRIQLNIPEPKTGVIFPDATRSTADENLLECLKYLANYFYYKFGLEFCYVTMVVCIGIRLDVFGFLSAVWLSSMFLLKRRTLAKIWPFYVAYQCIVLTIQYVVCLGLPPGFCMEYPWTEYLISGLRDWLFLPNFQNAPNATKVVADFFQLLFACCQLFVFRIETSPVAGLYEGGSNKEIDFTRPEPNPIPDFVTCTKGSVTGDRYWEEVLLPHVRLFKGAIGPDFIFMDDNARPHRTLAVEELLESEDITRMDWPAYSPDLNHIEHVWDALGRRIAARLHHPENTQQLKQMHIEQWALLPQEMLH
ncbi:piezo-type mechanosensitive ion channel component 1 [Trichonephila clavipes]|nr:piezo-type mechanosensitive ion channel component 1 [Trichonephila clavipes]